ncbi:hypothetical protein A2866_01885 [Candidatus Roizmanbacteria bacterium RIFCSPHIGHO2_01_FULL_39_8]|uniref:Fibronectin type-III domain-containing protein n=2 Tax=Candidatus Roizmaniibacteriota TaxID=1752723 RepID=A0A1F7GQ37_9BACT|nr:MAG: hypothetical protein A2866_01885 [Candidatus Roizmanbacteria bacterium RIFCSPHIGHO2_01_FULL_39_8]OGK38091.1 MAG: hypothetical protein A3F60_03540 [Candidatus Roizmanbacteria bacterium RIFCSPHIGHO2_12_FULL_39_8]
MNHIKIPRFLGYAVGGLLSVLILVFGFTMVQGVLTRAEDQVPRDVVISDITTSSAIINWATGTNTQGVIEYGVSPTTINQLAPEAESSSSHQLDLTLLSASTTYYFQISIGGKKYDNAGVPWTFSTKGTDEVPTSLSPSTRPTPISRVVIPNVENSCPETDCEKIKLKLGNGCTTQDYIKCVKEKSAPTFAPLTTP